MATTDSTPTDRTETTTSGDLYLHGTAPASVLQTTRRAGRIRNVVSRIKRALQ